MHEQVCQERRTFKHRTEAVKEQDSLGALAEWTSHAWLGQLAQAGAHFGEIQTNQHSGLGHAIVCMK